MFLHQVVYKENYKHGGGYIKGKLDMYFYDRFKVLNFKWNIFFFTLNAK